MTIRVDTVAFTDEGCRQSFLAFAMMAYEVLHPVTTEPFFMNWHVDAMCHQLEQVACGNVLRLIIEVPPRHLKSICASVALPAWQLGLNPAAKILVASYGAELAEKHSRDTRTLMNSPFYRKLFPRTRIAVDRAFEITTTARGMRKAVTPGGAVTGFGADLIIIDDLLKAADAGSEAETRKVQEFYESTLVPRLNDPATGKIIVIQQRLSERDLVGHLRGKGNFAVLSLPSIAQRDEDISLGRGRVHRRTTGDILFPAREPREELDRISAEITRPVFSAQYLQDPTPPGGNRIRWEWFGAYDFEPERAMFQYVVQSWDTGHSEEPTSSYSVGMTWGYKDNSWYLLDLVRARLSYPDLKRAALRLIGRWKPDVVLIEKASSGFSLVSDLRIQHGLRAEVRAVKPQTDKIARLEAATAELETGKFLLPANAFWREELRRECMAFPNGRHDDQVDSLSQFVEWQKRNPGRVSAEQARRGPTQRRRLRPRKE